MNNNVLLINPPFKYIKQTQIIPIGLLNLGTMLENNGINVKILDINAEKKYTNEFLPNPLTKKEFIQKIKKIDPDIIGLTSCTENSPFAMKIAHLCKSENDNVKIIFGGIHATFQAEECLNENPSLDVVVKGEAEHIIVDLVNALRNRDDLKKIPNIVYRQNGILKHSEFNSVPNLNEIPSFNLDLIKGKFYPSFLLQLEFGRGCPFHCCFCSLSPLAEWKIRFFPFKRIMNILQVYQEKFKNFSFYICDPTFLLNQKRVFSFIDEIKKQKMELRDWNFTTRIDTLNHSILKALRTVNAKMATIGIEDIHDSVLEAINKKQTFVQIEEGLKILKEEGFQIESNVIIGLPSQTKEHMLENIAYSKNIDFCGFPTLTPFPGSQIFNHPDKFGLTILTKNFELYTGREIVIESNVFPVDQQREILELMGRHNAQVQLQKESTYFFERKMFERILEIGFAAWNQEWKTEHVLLWN